LVEFDVWAYAHKNSDEHEEGVTQMMDFFKVKESKITYTEIPQDGNAYTAAMDKKYAVLAQYYDIVMTPLWKIWL